MAEITWQPYEPLPEYSHLMPSDTTLWNRFLVAYPDIYTAVAYDVLVGVGTSPPPDIPPDLIDMWAFLTARKIDVLARTDTARTIIELKPNAGLSAIGQLIGYRILFSDSYPMEPTPSLLLITDFLKPDISTICTALDISITVV